MEHFAILQEPFLSRIVDGTKTIESRWYKRRIDPWDKTNVGDLVHLKKTSYDWVEYTARVARVIQFADLDRFVVENIIDAHGANIGIDMPRSNHLSARYCILIWLVDVSSVPRPYWIDKDAACIGNAAAWASRDSFEPFKMYK